MKIKYSPQRTFGEETQIEVTGENALTIDGAEYEFDPEHIEWDSETLREHTDGKISAAHRDDSGELHLTIRRRYNSKAAPDWDTGDYHEITG